MYVRGLLGRGGAGMCEQALKSELRRRAVEGGASLVKAAVDVNSVKHDAKVGGQGGGSQSVVERGVEAEEQGGGSTVTLARPIQGLVGAVVVLAERVV